MTGNDDARARIDAALRDMGRIALAVSGGVDSMTLAHVAGRLADADCVLYHAMSPAVPAEATARIRRHAQAGGWRLEVLNAGEMQDPDYLANPVNRCFFCKTNLYSRIAAATDRTIVSGANVDDLGDYRPGLDAARIRHVRHPWIEAGIGKATIRRLAHDLGLDDLAELPASPCLSSRIETGIPVTGERLALIAEAEDLVRAELGDGTLRCRLRADGVVVELEDRLLAAVTAGLDAQLRDLLGRHGMGQPARIERYRRGSAFLQDVAGPSRPARREPPVMSGTS